MKTLFQQIVYGNTHCNLFAVREISKFCYMSVSIAYWGRHCKERNLYYISYWPGLHYQPEGQRSIFGLCLYQWCKNPVSDMNYIITLDLICMLLALHYIMYHVTYIMYYFMYHERQTMSGRSTFIAFLHHQCWLIKPPEYWNHMSLSGVIMFVGRQKWLLFELREGNFVGHSVIVLKT